MCEGHLGWRKATGALTIVVGMLSVLPGMRVQLGGCLQGAQQIALPGRTLA